MTMGASSSSWFTDQLRSLPVAQKRVVSSFSMKSWILFPGGRDGKRSCTGTRKTSARYSSDLSSTYERRASIFETPLRLMSKPAICNFTASIDCDQPRAYGAKRALTEPAASSIYDSRATVISDDQSNVRLEVGRKGGQNGLSRMLFPPNLRGKCRHSSVGRAADL